MKTGGGVSVWVKEAISERVHVVHVVGSVVDLLQEVLQLLDEDAFLEPLDTEAQQTSAARGFYLPLGRASFSLGPYLAASLMMFWRKMSRVSRVPWICFRRRKIFS